MYAVIKSGGRQYQVAVGEEVRVNRLAVEVGTQIRLEEVVLISDADNILVGTPLVSNAMVLATATEQGRGEKLIVFKYKSKKRYRHKRGHRQELTFLTIDDIVADGKSLVTGEAPVFKSTAIPDEEAEGEEETPESAKVETTPEVAETETSTTEESAPVEKKTRRRRSTKADESETKAEE